MCQGLNQLSDKAIRMGTFSPNEIVRNVILPKLVGLKSLEK